MQETMMEAATYWAGVTSTALVIHAVRPTWRIWSGPVLLVGTLGVAGRWLPTRWGAPPRHESS